MPGCENDDSVDFAVCVPDSADENLGSQNSNEVVKEDIKSTSETYNEHGTVNVNEHTVKPLEEPKLEDKGNSPVIDDYAISTTPAMDNRQSDNKEDHDNDTDNMSMQSTENVSVSESEKALYKSCMPTSKIDESSISPESTTSSGLPNEANSTIEESSTIVNDEQQRETATSYEVTSDVSIYSSRSYTTDSSFVSHDALDDASQFNSTTEATAPDSSVSSTSEDEAYSTSSLEISRTTQLPIENVSVVDDLDETSTIETSTAETTQEMLENEQSPTWMPTTETNNDASHSVMSAISTTEYSTNADTDSNVDIVTTDTSLLSSVYTSQPELDKETTTTTTTITMQYDDTSSTIPDSIPETTDQGLVSLDDVSTTMSDLNDYSDISTSTSNAMFSEPIADVEQHTTENALTFETSASPE